MKRVSAAVLAALLSACSGPPALVAGPDPSDPRVPVRKLRHADVTAGISDVRLSDPKPWTDSNHSVNPKGGQ